MATTTKRGSKTTETKQRCPKLKTSEAKQAQTVAELRQELEARNRDLAESLQRESATAGENLRLSKELQDFRRQLTEALEQQSATSEILRVIASSPTDPQPVFQTLLDNALRLCEAQNGAVFRFDGEVFRAVAWHNISLTMDAFVQSTPIRPGRESSLRRVGLVKRPVHIFDMLADPECIVPEPYREEGMRTNVAVPLLKENDLIGAIAMHRGEVRPFTENQIRLLETFADQAVIAIENVRLFNELEDRNHQLTESLEQQTATSEILGIIARSPTDIQPVLDAVAASAAGLCDATDAVIHTVEGDSMKVAANYGPLPGMGSRRGVIAITRDRIPSRAVIDGRTIHIRDLLAEPVDDLRADLARSLGVRTALSTPLLREGNPVGA